MSKQCRGHDEKVFTMTAAHAYPYPQPTNEVLVLDEKEEREAVNQALRSVGLTYPQLAEQARHRDFSSLQAQKLWVAIGGQGT